MKKVTVRVTKKGQYMGGAKIVPLEEARKLVLEYLKKRQECMTNDIIRDLELDRVLVLKVLGELEKEEQIEVLMGKVITL
jgi:DNA-binding MarR family transcriptional regulator